MQRHVDSCLILAPIIMKPAPAKFKYNTKMKAWAYVFQAEHQRSRSGVGKFVKSRIENYCLDDDTFTTNWWLK